MLYNIYCDESCHLEHDHEPVMVLGAVSCPSAITLSVAQRIRAIKAKHDIAPHAEIKWVKVSPSKSALYDDLITYFFSTTELTFRGLVVPDKSILRHEQYRQTHDDWYYKMYYHLLQTILDADNQYNIYIDIKDTRGTEKVQKLWQVLCSSKRDHAREVVRRVQQIRSHEAELLQLADLFIGALAYHNRGLQTSRAKIDVICRLQEVSGYSLKRNTPLRERKFNLFFWNPPRAGMAF